MTFDDLRTLLRKNGYRVKVKKEHKYDAGGNDLPGKENIYRFALVTGKNIYAAFCEANDGYSYRYIDGKIAADHKDCFNKWSQCPLCLPFPSDEEQVATLLTLLKRLGTKEGLEESSKFRYLDSNPYHY